MGLNGALFTGLTGMNVNSEWINVAGNNIANVNTVAFKTSRMRFETQIAQTLKPASGPSTNSGGRNASQVGMGARVGEIARNFKAGTWQGTGVDTEMAINGDGFYIIDVNGARRYTRAGNFKLDSEYNLVTPNGNKVQGFGIDSSYNVVEGVLTNIMIPKGLPLAEASSSALMRGSLNSKGVVATQGSINQTDAIYSDAAATTAALGTTLLTSLYTTAGGSPVLAANDIITVSGVQKGRDNQEGTVELTSHTFEVAAVASGDADANGTTVQDFLDFLTDILGIDTSVAGGVTINGSGEIVVTGNSGQHNDLTLSNANVTVGGTPLSLGWAKTQTANGESVRTSFSVYDSIGSDVNLDVIAVLEDADAGSTWRYYVQSEDDSDLDRVVSNGTLSFDSYGNFVSNTGGTILIDRDNTPAATPLTIRLNFDASMRALDLGSQSPTFTGSALDGAPAGELNTFAVSADGEITGYFSNGKEKLLGRIMLAMFPNNAGLVEEGGNIYNQSLNSGTPSIVMPSQNGSGTIQGQAVEMSNVDLSEEFINLINASTGFSASSRIITTSDQLIQELLNTIR